MPIRDFTTSVRKIAFTIGKESEWVLLEISHPVRLGELTMNEAWQSRITIEPGKRGGRPCIRGMRITVYDVLSYLAAGMTVAEVLDDFPYLTPEDIQACFAFAAERERSMLVTVA